MLLNLHLLYNWKGQGNFYKEVYVLCIIKGKGGKRAKDFGQPEKEPCINLIRLHLPQQWTLFRAMPTHRLHPMLSYGGHQFLWNFQSKLKSCLKECSFILFIYMWDIFERLTEFLLFYFINVLCLYVGESYLRQLTN